MLGSSKPDEHIVLYSFYRLAGGPGPVKTLTKGHEQRELDDDVRLFREAFWTLRGSPSCSQGRLQCLICPGRIFLA